MLALSGSKVVACSEYELSCGEDETGGEQPLLNGALKGFNARNSIVLGHLLPDSDDATLVACFESEFVFCGRRLVHSFFHDFMKLWVLILGNHRHAYCSHCLVTSQESFSVGILSNWDISPSS